MHACPHRLALTLALLLGMPVQAQPQPEPASPEQRLLELQQELEAQRRELAEQRQRLEAQQRLLSEQLELLRRAPPTMQSAPPPASASGRPTAPAADPLQALPIDLAEAETLRGTGDQAGGAAQRAPQIQAIAEIGGVLTPKGGLILEPSLQLSNSQVNRFTFLGVELIDTVLIGLIEASDTDRNLISAALTARYGLSNRLEAELKVPYTWRSDQATTTLVNTEQGGDNPSRRTDLDGNDIGDVELALHYQLNAGKDGWPFFIGNLRYKSTTGTGPWDVTRNAQGEGTELPTGSGFHAIEPSLTMIFPSDPAVFFANLGYLFHLEDDVDARFPNGQGGFNVVESADPGDTFRFSFGMGFALNQKASFTLGYKHDFIRETTTVINGSQLTSERLSVGAMLLGFGYRLSDTSTANINLEFGVTADAPDVVLSLRIPFKVR